MSNNEEKNIGIANSQAEMEVKSPKKPLYKNRIFWIAVSLALVCVAAVSVLHFVPGVNLFGSVNSKTGEVYLTNPVATLNGVDVDYNYQKFTFDKKHEKLDTPTSHVQGFAKYWTGKNNFNIITYSNVAGHFGYMYIVSDVTENGQSKYQYTLQVPATEIRHNDIKPNKAYYNPHFNHPCGVQVYGDYLVVPVIPYNTANGKFYDSTVVFIYDLSPLKGSSPAAPSQYKRVLNIPKVNGDSLSCAGIIKLADGRFAIGLVADNKLDMYTSSNKPASLWDATWNSTPERVYSLKASGGKNKYQGMGLLLNENSEVYMIGLDRRGGKDWADMYLLTSGGKLLGSGKLGTGNGTKNGTGTEIELDSNGTGFNNGGGIEVQPDKLVIYSTDDYYSGGGIVINWWAGAEAK